MSEQEKLAAMQKLLLEIYPDATFDYSPNGLIAEFSMFTDDESQINLSSFVELHSHKSVQETVDLFGQHLKPMNPLEMLSNLSDLPEGNYIEFRPYTPQSYAPYKAVEEEKDIKYLTTNCYNTPILWCLADKLRAIPLEERLINEAKIQKIYLQYIKKRKFPFDLILDNEDGYVVLVGDSFAELCLHDNIRESFLYEINKYTPVPKDYFIVPLARNTLVLTRYDQNKLELLAKMCIELTQLFLVNKVIPSERDVLILNGGNVHDQFRNEKNIEINILGPPRIIGNKIN